MKLFLGLLSNSISSRIEVVLEIVSKSSQSSGQEFERSINTRFGDLMLCAHFKPSIVREDVLVRYYNKTIYGLLLYNSKFRVNMVPDTS